MKHADRAYIEMWSKELAEALLDSPTKRQMAVIRAVMTSVWAEAKLSTESSTESCEC